MIRLMIKHSSFKLKFMQYSFNSKTKCNFSEGMSDNRPSIVEYFSKQQRSCGYCSSTRGSHSYELHAHTLKVEDYQNMIDRGWRRCGKYCYKPVLDISCCPLYIIRCAATEFKLSKTQKKILKRFNNFLVNGTVAKEKIHKSTEITQPMDTPCLNEGSKNDHNEGELMSFFEGSSVNSKIQNLGSMLVNSEGDIKMPDKVKASNISNKKDQPVEGKSMKAKQLRIERKRQKLQKLGLSEEEIKKKLVEKKRYPVVKTIADYLKETQSKKTVHNLRISLVRSSPRSEEFNNTFDVAFDLYKRYQRFIHKDAPQKLTQNQFERFLVISPLQVNLVLVNSPDFKKSFNESALLFAKYQKTIHQESDESCDIETFHRFLVDSPLEAIEGFGSYHKQYWLDDKLIAVGVIDILPNCVSSVYFFYDPAYSFLSLGTYGALREIELTRKLSALYPSLVYYYMGFYIHSCVKMKYKGAFRPSYLLCPEAHTWHLIQECLPKIEISKYSRFNDDPSAYDVNANVLTSEVGDRGCSGHILILYNRTAMTFDYYLNKKECSQEEREEVMEYAKLMGKTCAKNRICCKNATEQI